MKSTGLEFLRQAYRGLGEMEKLQAIINPDIGVITNIGDAHRENFPDDVTKASEKLKLFRSCSSLIYCRDHDLIRRLILSDKNMMKKELTDWSLHDKSASVFVQKNSLPSGHTEIQIDLQKAKYTFEVPFQDRASVENAITVCAVCLSMGIAREVIATGFHRLSQFR